MCFLKSLRRVCLIICLGVLLTVIVACKNNNTQMVTPVDTTVLAVPTVLATFADDEKPDTSAQGERHITSDESEKKQETHIVVELNKRGRGYAYIARVKDKVHVVHNGSVGKKYDGIDSSTLTLSPNGQRVAYGAKKGDSWYIVVDKREYGPFEDKGPPVFSPDNRHIAFEGKSNAFWYLHIDELKGAPSPSFFEKPLFSPDSKQVVRFENGEGDKPFRMVITTLMFASPVIHELRNINFKTDSQQSRLAFIDKVENKFQVKKFNFSHFDKVDSDAAYDEIRSLAFTPDGEHLAYIARNNGKNYLVFDGKETLVPEGEYPWPPVIRPDLKGVGVVVALAGKKGAYIHQALFDDGYRAPHLYKECADLAYSKDGKSHAYVAIRNERFLIVSNGKEGPMFDRVISPQFTPDGKYLVYRARQDGKRFVVLANLNGSIVKEFTRYQRVFDVTFTEDGKAIAYGADDGKQLMWKVEKLP